MNKVTNLINFYNRPRKDIINDLVNTYQTYPFSFREMLKLHGNKIITSIVIVRSPISNILYQSLNLEIAEINGQIDYYTRQLDFYFNDESKARTKMINEKDQLIVQKKRLQDTINLIKS